MVLNFSVAVIVPWSAIQPSFLYVIYFFEWVRRNKNDERSYNKLFYMFCKDIQDMDLINALQSLMTLFVETAQIFGVKITKC